MGKTRRASKKKAEPACPKDKESAVLAVGDLHGMLAPLENFLLRCECEGFMSENDLAPGVQMVFMGDYIDRGVQSRPVIERAAALKAANPGRVHCLLGNHELLALASLGDARRLLARGEVDATEDDYEWTPHGRQGGWWLVREFGGLSAYVEAMHPRAPMGAFMRSLEPSVELRVGARRALFVHAGIPRHVSTREDFEFEVSALRRLLANDSRLTSQDFDVFANRLTGMDGMLWDRSIPRQHRIGVSHLPASLGVDMLVIGHTRHERITCYGGCVYAVDLSGQDELSALLLRPGRAPAIFGPCGEISEVG